MRRKGSSPFLSTIPREAKWPSKKRPARRLLPITARCSREESEPSNPGGDSVTPVCATTSDRASDCCYGVTGVAALPPWFSERFPSRYVSRKLFSSAHPTGFGFQPLPEALGGPDVSVPERATLELLVRARCASTGRSQTTYIPWKNCCANSAARTAEQLHMGNPDGVSRYVSELKRGQRKETKGFMQKTTNIRVCPVFRPST